MPKPRVLMLQDYLAMLRRRWHLIVLPILAGGLIGYGLTVVLPKSYTSQALMLVEQQQVPHDFVEPVITEDLNERIANIEEQTLSRTRLQPLIERYGLFKGDAANKSMDDLVLLMQKAITLTPVEPVVRAKEPTIPGFYLSVTLDDPRIAQQVCSDITSMFIDEDIHQRQRSAEGTTSFLQTQLDDAKAKLDEQDGILAAFERKNMGMLPDEEKTNLGMLSTLNTQLQAVTDNLNRSTQDKAYFDSLLAQQLQAWKLTAAGRDSVSLPDQLAKLQAELTLLQAHYTDQYPDVVKVKAAIADVKKQISDPAAPSTDNEAEDVGGSAADVKKQISVAATPPNGKGPDDISSSADGVKKQMSATATASNGKGGQNVSSPTALEPPEIQKLRGQVRASDQAVKTETLEQQHLKADIKSYESRLQLSPAVDEEYKKITRDHDTALKFYDDLLAKRDESGMATDLERRQEGEQLSVMDPADLPSDPSFPKLTIFGGGGLGAGLALGLALVLGMGSIDKRIRTGRDVQYYLGTTPFALIPSIEIPAISSLAGPNGTRKTRMPRKLMNALGLRERNV